MAEPCASLTARHRVFGPGANWRSQSLLILAGWTVVGLISMTRHYMFEVSGRPRPPLWVAGPMWLTCFYAWALLTPLIFLLGRKWPLTRGRWMANVLLHIPASVLFTWIALLASHVMSQAILLRAPHPLDFFQQLQWGSFVKHFPFYWSTLAAGTLLSSFKALREKERRAAQLELERSQLESSLRQAQLDALRMQLNPHFLFNTLQTISVLMLDDVVSANQMLVRLSDLLRTTLRHAMTAEMPLKEEIAFLEAYLAIEEIRFADRLRVNWHVDRRVKYALLPTLLLQPLVENAIRHGIARMAGPGSITISATGDGPWLRLTVADTGPGLTSSRDGAGGHGIGLNNTRNRLKQLYPEHEMKITAGPTGGFRVEIALPLHFAAGAHIVAEELPAL